MGDHQPVPRHPYSQIRVSKKFDLAGLQSTEDEYQGHRIVDGLFLGAFLPLVTEEQDQVDLGYRGAPGFDQAHINRVDQATSTHHPQHRQPSDRQLSRNPTSPFARAAGQIRADLSHLEKHHQARNKLVPFQYRWNNYQAD